MFAWLGSLVYGNPSLKIFVLGVTGTKGKSTVLELINVILESAGEKTALLSSVRIKIGSESRKNPTNNTMPGRFFIRRFLRDAVAAGCKYALLEVTSQGVTQYRHKFIDFDAALFLNLHPEHIEAHGSFEKYRAAKVKFFADVAAESQKPRKMFFVNQEDRNHGYFVDAIKKCGEVYYFGRDQFVATKLAKRRVSIGDWLANDFNLENAAAAVRVTEILGVDWQIAKKALAEYKGLAGRIETVQEKPFKVVVDYAHTPDSLESVYGVLLKRQEARSKRQERLICILGSAGGGRDKWKRPRMGAIAASYCDRIILTNEDPYDENPEEILRDIESGFVKSSGLKHWALNKDYYKVLDRREAIKKAITLAKKGDTVIITGKGSEHWIHIENGKKIPWNEKTTVEEILLNK